MAKPNFSKYDKTKKPTKTKKDVKAEKLDAENIEIRYIQGRFEKNDAIRYKRAAEDNGLTLHNALVEAINLQMVQWGESPLANVGTTKKER